MNSLFAESNIYIPIRIKSPLNSSIPIITSVKSITWADITKTPKKSGAKPWSIKSPITSSSGS